MHWAFVSPKPPPVPTVKTTSWVRNDVDRFVLARLEAVGLGPAPEADRVTLIRRLSLDLRGFPPGVEEIDAFLADGRVDAYERLVDRYLADAAYGEKMATPWLDLARFGDTNGYQDDETRAMWLYRDYVIDAFNASMPFDQFTIENLAGDLLPEATLDQKIASGFNRNHRFNEEGGSDPEEFLVAYAVDRTNTTATTWLGLTFECSPCHDHKYDPISQKDYYQLYAFFNSVNGALGVSSDIKQPPFIDFATPEQVVERKRLQREMGAVEEKLKAYESKPEASQISLEEFEDLKEEEDRLFRENRAFEHSIPSTMIMEKMTPRRPAFVLERGDFRRQGEQVVPMGPAFLRPIRVRGASAELDRLDLALWLVDGDHPLVGRVVVNRVWKQIFGVGLVTTASDFGTRGDLPSHPALLDWLATEFRRLDWDFKALRRILVLSSTYRQAFSTDARALERAPENRLLWRAPRYRLLAEEIRDTALAIAGLLSHKKHGPSVRPHQPDSYFADKSRDWSWELSPGEDQYRRGIYTFWRRTTPSPGLVLFDAPSRGLCTAERPRTNTPLQALLTLNGVVYVEAARVFAESLLLDDSRTDRQRVARAHRRALARWPSDAETEVLLRLLNAQRER
jgi:hypothetical protein